MSGTSAARKPHLLGSNFAGTKEKPCGSGGCPRRTPGTKFCYDFYMPKFKLKPRAGSWWQLVDDKLPLWVRIGPIDTTPLPSLTGMARLAWVYYGVGILGSITSVGWIGDLDGCGNGVDMKTGEVL
jgi:hypothetical protein